MNFYNRVQLIKKNPKTITLNKNNHKNKQRKPPTTPNQ